MKPDHHTAEQIIKILEQAEKGEQTIADQRAERAWLQKFREANAAGNFQKYFIDKSEAQKWIDTADARWAKLSSMPQSVLDNPVTLTMQEIRPGGTQLQSASVIIGTQSNGGWAASFALTDYKAKELFYRIDGKGDFKSTGFSATKSPQTGLPMVNLYVPLPNLVPGEHTMDVKYVDKNEQMNGPYTLKFSTMGARLAQTKMSLNSISNSWLEFRDFNGKLLLYFTALMRYRPVIKEVSYSLNSDALDKTFKFKPTDKMFDPGDDVLITVPKDTQFATAQVTFTDGTASSVQKFVWTK